jgi:putative membrane protein
MNEKLKDENIHLVSEKHDSAKENTEMAVERTVMAADRSLMAWIRTGLSLISFGFTIYKFLAYSREQLIATGKDLHGISSPKVVGLFMIGMGILSLIFGTLENFSTVKSLRGRFDVRRKRYALLMAIMVTIFGLIIFLGIIFQVRGIGTL